MSNQPGVEWVPIGPWARGIVSQDGDLIAAIVFWQPAEPLASEDHEPAVFDAGFFALRIEKPHGREPLFDCEDPSDEDWTARCGTPSTGT